MADSVTAAWQRDALAIYVAVVLAEVTVLVAQAVWPFLAERVRLQQEAWNTPLARADQALPGQGGTPDGG